MALEDILRAMEGQAQAEAAAILAKAEAEAREIKTRHSASIMPRLRDERTRLLSEAKLVALREVMDAREALLEDAFNAAQVELAGLRDKPEYPRYLNQLTREVVGQLGDELSIVVDARDEARMYRITGELGVQARISIGLDTAGGLEGSTPDGRVTVVNTIEMRLQRSRRYLRRDIAFLLSAEDVSCQVTMAMPASER